MGPETKERLFISLAVLSAWAVGACLFMLTAFVLAPLTAVALFVVFLAATQFLIVWCWPETLSAKRAS